jgi:hypothetical protein
MYKILSWEQIQNKEGETSAAWMVAETAVPDH